MSLAIIDIALRGGIIALLLMLAASLFRDFSQRPAGRYGAGFWTNLGDVSGANYRLSNGWPRDAFFAKGSIGQYVIIIPSQRLVIARFGRTTNFPLDADGVSQLVRDVIAATAGKEKLAGRN